MKTSAIISNDGKYRYELRRTWWNWTAPQLVMFIMLNPSTADDVIDDATITRCINYAMAWGYGGLIVGNLFGHRSKDKKQIRKQADPVGKDNDRILLEAALEADMVICAWGNDGKFMDRSRQILSLLRENGINPQMLTMTKQGEPGHPLYLKKNLEPIPLEAE